MPRRAQDPPLSDEDPHDFATPVSPVQALHRRMEAVETVAQSADLRARQAQQDVQSHRVELSGRVDGVLREIAYHKQRMDQEQAEYRQRFDEHSDHIGKALETIIGELKPKIAEITRDRDEAKRQAEGWQSWRRQLSVAIVVAVIMLLVNGAIGVWTTIQQMKITAAMQHSRATP